MKACINCKHFHVEIERGPICMRFAKIFDGPFDPVYGAQKRYSAPDCKVARSEGGQCGPNARSYESKTPHLEEAADALIADTWTKPKDCDERANDPPTPSHKSWWSFDWLMR